MRQFWVSLTLMISVRSCLTGEHALPGTQHAYLPKKCAFNAFLSFILGSNSTGITPYLTMSSGQETLTISLSKQCLFFPVSLVVDCIQILTRVFACFWSVSICHAPCELSFSSDGSMRALRLREIFFCLHLHPSSDCQRTRPWLLGWVKQTEN